MAITSIKTRWRVFHAAFLIGICPSVRSEASAGCSLGIGVMNDVASEGGILSTISRVAAINYVW